MANWKRLLIDTRCPQCGSDVVTISGAVGRLKGTKKIPDAYNGYIDIVCKKCDFWTTGRTIEDALNRWKKAAGKPMYPTDLDAEDFVIKIKFASQRIGTEEAHMEMDKLMCEKLRELGYGKAVDIFESTGKWYA